ncbi:glycosyltransferase family 4 protein, partial [Candidatus Woesearchaeota archaeon]|nr:glycosyltransferase family 4 protein [Candidatus Woesearchaeota archaeon]
KDKQKDYEMIRVPTFKFRFGDYHPPKFHFEVIREAVLEADIVWTNAVMPIGMLAIHYAKKFNKPVIATIHSIEWELAKNSLSKRNVFKNISYAVARILARHFYNKCALLMISDRETGEILKHHGIRTMKRIVHLGVNTERFIPAEDKRYAKERIGLETGKVVIGYSGRIGREKDVMTLYRAFRKVRTEDKNVVLLLVGNPLEEFRKILEKDEDVVLAGTQDDVVPYLQAMDIYVLPSLTETTSLSTMEAMSCGLAVVATKVGFVKEYIMEKVNGVFFPKRNDLVLSLKLKSLIGNPTLREVMGVMARQTIEKNYSWKKTVREIRETFIKI